MPAMKDSSFIARRPGGQHTADSLSQVQLPLFLAKKAIDLLCLQSQIAKEEADRFFGLAKDWLHFARITGLEKDGSLYAVAMWLTEDVEQKVDAGWKQSAYEGYIYDSLAGGVTMALVGWVFPGAAKGICVPRPMLGQDHTRALEDQGIFFWKEKELLPLRRYAVLSSYPHMRGCEQCALHKSCTQKNMLSGNRE